MFSAWCFCCVFSGGGRGGGRGLSAPAKYHVYLMDGSAEAIACAAITETKVDDQTCYLTQPQQTDTRPTSTSPSTDSRAAGTGQGGHWSTSFEVTGLA